MRPAIRWVVGVAVSAAAFAASWWVSQEVIRLDETAAIGIASAMLAIVLALDCCHGMCPGSRAGTVS